MIGFSNAGTLAEGLYRVPLPDRDVPGLLVAGAPEGDMPLGFVTCGPECAGALDVVRGGLTWTQVPVEI
ncbi:MAG: hypothetical protein ACREM1_22975 [Longimicrobiales bacterium]